MITVPFMNDYLSIVALFILYSVSIGTWFVNLAPVLADFHGIDKIASSYGLARMFHGLSTLITPPIFGTCYKSAFCVAFLVAFILCA